GFSLNGQPRKFKGVCNHHDLGPLGAAINTAALRHQLAILKEMGCDAIRTSHNMPAPELMQLCDEMGFMVMVESFDEWKSPKVKNGYSQYFDQWVEKDLTNMVHRDRNHPSARAAPTARPLPSACKTSCTAKTPPAQSRWAWTATTTISNTASRPCSIFRALITSPTATPTPSLSSRRASS
nr:beta-galactosidase [Tanacetum cinerariifolium]